MEHFTVLCYNTTYLILSLRNMYKELQEDIEGFAPPDHGYLAGWAVQGHLYTPPFQATVYARLCIKTTVSTCFAGVLLLNACLTVREREPNSHAGKVRTFFQTYMYVPLCLLYVYVYIHKGLGEAD